MEIELKPGADYTPEQLEGLRKAAAHARSFRTEATAETARRNGKKGGRKKGSTYVLSPEGRARIQAAQAERRAKEAKEQEQKETGTAA